MQDFGIDEALDQALAWQRQGRRAAIATVVETWGSAPRPAGSQLAVAADGSLYGSVSGGCVEAAVVEAALGVIETGRSRLLDFGVSDQSAFALGLACGGRIRVYVQSVAAVGEPLIALEAARRDKRPAVLATALNTDQSRLLFPLESEERSALMDAARDALSHDAPRVVEHPAGAIFLGVFNPPRRMAIVGAVHIAQALAPMATIAGYSVTVIDPRRAFASPSRFAGVALSNDWPDKALARFSPDLRSAVITLTHDPKIDDEALDCALRTPSFYIAALGSRRSHAARLERLAERGHAQDALARINGPAGLPIGAKSPAEIALSILSQATRTLRLGNGTR